ncbi:amidase family protein, partial [Pseudomonas aeruginosa]|uniref:amidase family protein n=1 Tax=Pseudomonas aeruginosa TaxID=287 RepID=UPI00397B3E75
GFPQAPKDLAATAGMVTAMGSLAMARNVPTHDSIVVERIRRQGTVLIGKTNTPEFGLGSHTYNRVYGTTRNTW